jgi:lysozyme
LTPTLKNKTKTRELLIYNEGRSGYAYQDSRKVWTIGVGRNVDNRHPNAKLRGPGLRDSEIDLMLDNDIEDYAGLLSHALPWFAELDEARQAVLVDMCHQLGFWGLLKFENMLSALAQNHFSDAAAELQNSLLHKQTPERTERNRQILLRGKWPA